MKCLNAIISLISAPLALIFTFALEYSDMNTVLVWALIIIFSLSALIAFVRVMWLDFEEQHFKRK